VANQVSRGGLLPGPSFRRSLATRGRRSDKPKGIQKSGLQELQDPTGDRGSVKFQGIRGSAGSPEPDLSNAAFRTLSNVPESTASGRFEIRGFAGSSDPFSSRMSALVSFFFQMGPNASGAHQS
jgi:hypothetical protein